MLLIKSLAEVKTKLVSAQSRNFKKKSTTEQNKHCLYVAPLVEKIVS